MANRKVKNERLFVRFSRFPAKNTEKGKEQFFEAQSFGKFPSEPDSYYICLNDGKIQFDLICRELQQLYIKREWWDSTNYGWIGKVSDG